MGKSLFKTVLPFLPLLAGYIVVILSFSSNEFFADEGRHMVYATNLTNGYYTEAENPEIGNGPGYPMVMAPFVFFDAPFISIKLLNAFLLLMAVVYFFKTLSIYISAKSAIALSYLLGVYPALLKWMIYMHSEALAFLLACGFLYHFVTTFASQNKRYRHIFFSALFLGFLVLTKVIFAYVLLICSAICGLLLFFKKSKKIKSTLVILAGALMICTPYLIYTYSITGKLFYWGTGGGQILYWRSTPFPSEYGDWITSDNFQENKNADSNGKITLYKNHGAFIESMTGLSAMEKDARFKEKAIKNMKSNPIKYIKNTAASFSRLFFNYPYSYTPQKLSSYAYIIPNMFLLVFLSIALFLAWANRKKLAFEIWFTLGIPSIFILGLTLLDGRVRHLLPCIPLLLFFVAYVFQKFVKVKNGRQIEFG